MSQKTTSVPEGYIVDYLDGKFRKDTPEEYVRQMVEKRVVNEHDYSRDQIKVEETIKIGDSKKRVDIAIYPENSGHAQKDIQIIIECKKESVNSTNKQEGVGQLKSYMAAIVRISNNPYKWEIGCGELKDVANVEKMMPNNYISEDGFSIWKWNGITENGNYEKVYYCSRMGFIKTQME